jgi:anti-anti-sigma factor
MIRVTVQDGVSKVVPDGSLDLGAITELQEVLERSALAGDVAVDLSGVTMLSSSAIGALIAGHNALRARGRRLRIEGATDGIRHLLRLMGLDRHFDIAG